MVRPRSAVLVPGVALPTGVVVPVVVAVGVLVRVVAGVAVGVRVGVALEPPDFEDVVLDVDVGLVVPLPAAYALGAAGGPNHSP